MLYLLKLIIIKMLITCICLIRLLFISIFSFWQYHHHLFLSGWLVSSRHDFVFNATLTHHITENHARKCKLNNIKYFLDVLVVMCISDKLQGTRLREATP